MRRERSASTTLELEAAIERLANVRRRWFVLLGFWIALFVVECQFIIGREGPFRPIAIATALVAIVGCGICVRGIVDITRASRRLRNQLQVQRGWFGDLLK